MKAKYHPNYTILEAQLGSKPSFAWRSIQGACNIVSEGLIWRIGDGASVRIWGDKWLPNPSSYMVQSPEKIVDGAARVRDLFYQDVHGWNLRLLTQIFNAEEVQVIQSVPISFTKQPDTQVWRGTRTGLFTISSAYHFVKERDDNFQPARRGSNDLWRGLWKMQTSNAIKNFMWRACKKILPTKDNLMKRRVVEDSLCPICSLEAETS